MNEQEKVATVELIRRIQPGAGRNEDFTSAELATGNPGVWTLFDELELEGFSPDRLLNLPWCAGEIQGSQSINSSGGRM